MENKILSNIPIIVTFHDVNVFTAHHMTEYLHILIEEAERVGLSLDKEPFYDTRNEIVDATLHRVVPFNYKILTVSRDSEASTR